MSDQDWNPPKGKGGAEPVSNPLLVRPELAKVKNTTYTLPAPGHTYGKPMERDAEDASSVTMSWKAHTPNAANAPGTDFRALNRQAVVEGNFTSKAQARYRQANQDKQEFRLQQGQAVSAKAPSLPSDGNNEYMYGKASRPSTPIEFLMTNSYLRSYVEDQKDKHESSAGAGGGKQPLKPVKSTKSTQLRKGHVKEMLQYEERESDWKMSKFANVQSRYA